MFSAFKEAWKVFKGPSATELTKQLEASNSLIAHTNERYEFGVKMGSGFMVLALLSYKKGDDIIINVNDLKALRDRVTLDGDY